MGTISPAVINAESILTNVFGVYILQVLHHHIYHMIKLIMLHSYLENIQN